MEILQQKLAQSQALLAEVTFQRQAAEQQAERLPMLERQQAALVAQIAILQDMLAELSMQPQTGKKEE